jgi:hypothetical protein
MIMKNTFFVLLFSVFSMQLMAQSANIQTVSADVLAKETTIKITEKYHLNADQAKQIYKIQARKLRNLEQIAVLQSENPKMYLAKLESVHNGTLASIKRTLKTQEQMDVFNKTMAEIRNKKAVKRKEMMTQSATKEAIEAALIDIYFE